MVQAEVLLSPSPHPGWEASPSQGSPPPCPQQYVTGTKFSRRWTARMFIFWGNNMTAKVRPWSSSVQMWRLTPFPLDHCDSTPLTLVTCEKEEDAWKVWFHRLSWQIASSFILVLLNPTNGSILVHFSSAVLRVRAECSFLAPRYLLQNRYNFVFSSKTFVPVTHNNKRISLVGVLTMYVFCVIFSSGGNEHQE